MKYKVCILAAGIGSRMKPFTEHINKSLLPVNFKAVISHIIEKFDTNIEIVVAVGHLKETVIDYLDCAHKDRKFTIVEVDRFTGKGSGPGYSLMQCRDHLNLPFVFFASDTLVLEDIPPPIENWLGVSPVIETKEYCTAKIVSNMIVGLDDKIVSDNENAFVGVAGVRDYKIFFEALSRDTELKDNELQVSNGFSALMDYDLRPNYFTWYDTGNINGYSNANKKMSKLDCAFDFSKSDEFLYFVGNKVIKYFKDKLIIKNRYTRSKILHGLCPKIICIKDSFYTYDKVGGKVLYDTINDQVMHDFIHWIDKNLWINVKISNSQRKIFKSACLDFYYKKTLSRIDKYQKKHQIKDQSTNINGVKVPSIEKMLSLIDWDYMSTGIASNFHGDLQFDNILLKENNDFLILDWRQDFSGIIDFGDQYYDLAKLNGGMKVSYKLIKQNKFSFHKDSQGDITIDHEPPPELNRARKIFKNYLNNKNLDVIKVSILTGLVYLNMSPMHHEPFDHFIYNLGRLTLYKALLRGGKIHAVD
jgi:CTP:phosphocholine cytidylyltransferase-like protein